MSDILNKAIVLVLNRNWQAINIRTPADAFCQMATNVATALDIELGQDSRAHALRPVTWGEWITLPVREGDHAVRTAHSIIRVPTVIVAVNFAKVPKKRPKLSARNIRERDGNRCQYTGRLLHPDEGSLDHVVPRSLRYLGRRNGIRQGQSLAQCECEGCVQDFAVRPDRARVAPTLEPLFDQLLDVPHGDVGELRLCLRLQGFQKAVDDVVISFMRSG
jgi:5-methylcytosine-specific restriction endonuclease McrA